MMTGYLSPTFTTLLVAVIATCIVSFLRSLKKVFYLPGLRCLFHPISPFGALIPTCWWNPGMNWQWKWRNEVYSHSGTDTISLLALTGYPTICTRSLEVARQVVSNKGQFDKIHDQVQGAKLWGPNLFSVPTEEWRRHRRILAPAFNNDVYASVWDETLRTYDEMVAAEGWADKHEIYISDLNQITMKLALIIISRCGFGNHIPWDFSTDTNTPKDGQMSFAESLLIVTKTNIERLVYPRWAYKLPIKKLQEIEAAYKSLGVYMASLIKSKKAGLIQNESMSGKGEMRDVFGLMVEASEAEGKLGMSDEELAGNTFIMLFAGHDTTAHTLEATLGFLGLYPEIQDELYAQIKEVASDASDLTFQNSSKLFKVRAAFLEAARLFPAAFLLLRSAMEDSILQNVGPNGTEQIVVEKGVQVMIDVVGIHHNPKYYPEPETFRLDRWYDATENDMVMFSVGPRSCIGRRFAISEAVSFLSRLLYDWKVEIILERGETREEWRRRVMKAHTTMTLSVGTIPVKLVRRT